MSEIAINKPIYQEDHALEKPFNGLQCVSGRFLVFFTLFFISFFIVSLQTVGAASKNALSAVIDFNLYPYLSDIESDTVYTLNIAANLQHGFSYFSLSNFSNQSQTGELGDINAFYTEQNIRWRMGERMPLDLTVQLNFRSGEDNDRHRLGFRWRLNDTPGLQGIFDYAHLAYSLNFHVVQFDDVDADVWQIEHVFRLSLPQISERLYLAGFIDHTFNEDLPANIPSNPIVGEAQLGVRLVENLYAVTEYRVNQYRRTDVNNIAAGLEYIIKW